MFVDKDSTSSGMYYKYFGSLVLLLWASLAISWILQHPKAQKA
jgi:hypothetical protein